MRWPRALGLLLFVGGAVVLVLGILREPFGSDSAAARSGLVLLMTGTAVLLVSLILLFGVRQMASYSSTTTAPAQTKRVGLQPKTDSDGDYDVELRERCAHCNAPLAPGAGLCSICGKPV